MQATQKMWRRTMQISFIAIIVITTSLFVAFPYLLPGALMQLIMLLSMGSLFSLFFLDRLSFMLSKRKFTQDVMHQYFFKNLKPDDVHRDAELVVELVSKRRRDGKSLRT